MIYLGRLTDIWAGTFNGTPNDSLTVSPDPLTDDLYLNFPALVSPAIVFVNVKLGTSI